MIASIAYRKIQYYLVNNGYLKESLNLAKSKLEYKEAALKPSEKKSAVCLSTYTFH